MTAWGGFNRLVRGVPAPAGAVAGGVICLAILCGMMVRHAWPLWTGTVVVLRAVPVDPRDLFRGEFVRLSTPAEALLVTSDPAAASTAGELLVRPTDPWWTPWPPRTGQAEPGAVVYAQLERHAETGEYRPLTISRAPVDGALNLKGRIRPGSDPPGIRVDYGLGAFYMQEGTALPVEQAILEGSTVQMEVAIASDGRARIRNLIIDGTPLPRR